GALPLKRRHLELGAHRRLREGDRDLAHDVVLVPREELMLPHVDVAVEVAGRPPVARLLALPRHAHPRAVLDPRGDRDLDLALDADQALALAGRAGRRDPLPLPAA